MLYENYQNRIKTIADVLRQMLRMWPLVLLRLLMVVAAISAFFITKGMVTSVDHPSSIVYGESVSYNSKAFLSRSHVEYNDGSGNWSDEAPIMPGTYKARAVGRGVFGKEKPGEEFSFTIEKRPVSISSKGGSIRYGEFPELSADLSYGDTILCEEFELSSPFLRQMGETEQMFISSLPIKSGISIKDVNGNDVTEAYEISVIREDLRVIPRRITVTVEDATKVYDGIELSYDGYEISKGDVADGDTLYAYFDQSRVDAGVTENVPSLIVVDKSGINVTPCYDITVVKGKLTIEKRPLIISTNGGNLVYDGNIHSFDGFELSKDTPLVKDQSISLNFSAYIDAGEYKNTPDVIITSKDGKEVSKNYSIFFEAGTVIISPRPITVRTTDAAVTYNGRDHWFYRFGVEIIKGELCAKDFIVTESSGSALEVGVYQNDTKITVKNNQYGKDVSGNYDITYEYGTVEILKRVVEIETLSYSWMYDGKEHSYETVGLSIHSSLGSYDAVMVVKSASILDAGRRDNVLELKIVRYVQEEGNDSPSSDDRSYTDMTHNYDIRIHYGTLTVYARPITLKPVDAEKVYDGEPLVAKALETTGSSPYSLVEGHTAYEFETTGRQTNVGTKTNYIIEGSVRICDSDGRDVTPNYIISTAIGELTVTPREILVETASDSKKYDGTPLTNGDYSISSESPYQLVAGHTLRVVNIGSITEVGITENICNIDETNIVDLNGQDVTSNYLIKYSYGTLEILDDPGGSGGGSGGSGGGAGGGLSESGELGSPAGSGSGEPVVVIKVKGEKSDYLYLRLKSFGGYTGSGWNEATEYPEMLLGQYSANYLSALALGQSSYKLDVEVLGDQYFLPYYVSLHDVSGHTVQTSDVMYHGDSGKIYSVSYKSYDYKTPFSLPKEYVEFEEAYRSFVYSQYLIIDDETREYMKKIINSQGFVGNDIETILRAAQYIQNSARYDLDYDRALDEEENIAIAFLETYRTGICQHYATAATLLFRAMGIPARYTVGFVAQTAAGEWTDVTSDNGHAWVEVYIDGMGWIQIEATGGGDFGHNGSGGMTQKETIVVRPTYQYKKYDGKVLYASDIIDIDMTLKDLLQKGYSWSVSVDGKQLEVGRSDSVPYNFKLYDPFGINVTDDYDIVYENGVLEVLHPDMTIIMVELYQLQKYYDGKPLSFEEGDYRLYNIPEGVKVSVDIDISLVDVGGLTLSKLNSNVDEYATLEVEGADQTYYKIKFVAPRDISDLAYIPIRVDARPLTVTASSATKEYDGEYLTCDEWYITKGSLCDGHTATATLNGSIKQPGSEINMITGITITDADGNDVTQNYSIILIDGLLTVTK